MTSKTTPATERSAHAAPPARGRATPLASLRNGGMLAFLGLAIALISLFVPWISGQGQQITGLGVTEVLDLRSMAPLNFLGLVVLGFLTSVTLFTRLGIFAIANALVASAVLVAHLTFTWVLFSSTDPANAVISGLPSGVSVTYGPFLAAAGFLVMIIGSVWAAKSAEYLLPDRAEARLRDRD